VREVAAQIAANAPLTLRSVKLVIRELGLDAAARDAVRVRDSIHASRATTTARRAGVLETQTVFQGK
jgi:hypothetical protein